MILISALYKGIIGGLGALVCFLLYILFIYYKSLFKQYIVFIKKKDATLLKLWEVSVFGITSFVFSWIIIFSLLNAILDWRTLGTDDNAYIAFIICLLIFCVICFPYYKYSNNGFNLKNKFKQYKNNLKISFEYLKNNHIKGNNHREDTDYNDKKIKSDDIVISESDDVKRTNSLANNIVDLFFRNCFIELKYPAYTHRELTLFVTSIKFGSDLISQLKGKKDPLILDKLFYNFIGNDSPKRIINYMQGMSYPYFFADDMHISSKLEDFLDKCTSISFEEKIYNGTKIRMLNLFQSMNFYTLVHLSNELKNITLQDIFDKKNHFYINEITERTAPSAVCTPIEQWPILETINRAEIKYREFIIEFILKRLEYYNTTFLELDKDESYLKLAKAIISEPLNADTEMVFTINDYDPWSMEENELIKFKEYIDHLTSVIKK